MAREIAGRKEIVKTNSVHKEKSLLLPAFRLPGSLWGWGTCLCFHLYYILLHKVEHFLLSVKSRAYTSSGFPCICPLLLTAITHCWASNRVSFLSLKRVTLRHISSPFPRTVTPHPLHPYQNTHTRGETCSKNVSLSKQVLAIERHQDVHGIYLKWSFAFFWHKKMYKVNLFKGNLSRDRYLALSPSSINQLKNQAVSWFSRTVTAQYRSTVRHEVLSTSADNTL